MRSLFGLRVHFQPVVQGVETLEVANGKPDVEVALGEFPEELLGLFSADRELWYASPERGQDGVPISQVWVLANGEFYYFAYQDGTEFLIDQGGSRVWGRWPQPYTLEDTAVYLLGPIMGFVLHLHGTLCLHASAVVLDGRAIALVGGAGRGKSTTAAAFARLGYPVLTEDIVRVTEEEGVFWVQPGYPRIRLWEDSVTTLFDAPDALPYLTPNWEKRYLDLRSDNYRFQSEPVPLGAIYLLSERQDDSSAPRVAPLAPQEKVMGLVPNTYMVRLPDIKKAGKDFETLGRIVAAVPVKQVVSHTDSALVSALCKAIVEDYRLVVF